MPVVTVRARGKRPATLDALVRKASATASSLLAQSARVLVVYDNGCASIYYEAEGTVLPMPQPHPS